MNGRASPRASGGFVLSTRLRGRVYSCSNAALQQAELALDRIADVRARTRGTAWIVASSRRTAICSVRDRRISTRRRSGRSLMF